MLEHWLNSIVPTLQSLGHWGYVLIFFIFFFEAIVGLGLIVPGTILAFLLGTLVSQNVFNFYQLLMIGTLGFFMGDTLSFMLGRKGTGFFSHEARFLKLSHLDKGRAFFARHGSKSLLLGRFLGPVRPFVPFIAGLVKMSWPKFLILNTTSIVLWLYIHLLAGYFFGQTLWIIKLWSSRLEVLAIYVATIAGFIWLSKQLLIRNGRVFGVIIISIWRSFVYAVQQNEELQKFYHRHQTILDWIYQRFTKDNFFGRPLTILSVIFVYTGTNLLILTNNVFSSSTIIGIDHRLESLMNTFKNFFFMKFFVGVTVLGGWQMISLLILLASFVLIVNKRQKVVPILFGIVTSAYFTNILLKNFIDRPRPQLSFYLEKTASFPSAHATIAITFFGFIFYLYYKKLTEFKHKINAIFFFGLIITLIGFSRLYLRVHYFSDVIGGYLFGFLWLLIGIGVLEYLNLATPPSKQEEQKNWTKGPKITIVMLIMLTLISYSGLIRYYRTQLNLIQLEPVPTSISTNILDDFKKYNLDQYSQSFDGENQEPISLIISASSANELTKTLEKINYFPADKPNFQALLKTFRRGLVNQSYAQLPISPSFWETEVNDLAFTRRVGGERHYLKLWQTKFKTPNGKVIYVGIAGAKSSTRLIIKKKMNPNIDGEREAIFEMLSKNKSIASWSRHQFISPQIVKKFLDEYFTDGKLYIIDLK